MSVSAFDHVNIRTARLADMIAWYDAVLGLKSGARPNFPFGGAWLYLGEKPLVHLIEDTETNDAPAPRLEHFAFRASDLAGFTRMLAERGQKYQIGSMVVAGMVQVNVWDPDGNHIHIDFPEAEADAMGLAP